MEAANAFDNKNTDTVVHFSALRLLGDETKDKALLMGERLLASQPNNRWVLLAQCYLLQQRKRESDASYCFQRILDLPNQHPDFLNRLFLVWSWTALAQMSMNDDPQKSKHYLMKVVESGITGQSLQQAQQLLKQLK
jgi:predicted Zn-dependent protease